MQKRPTPLKPIGPYAYGAIGCGLMLFKYLVEYALVVGQARINQPTQGSALEIDSIRND